MSMSTGPYAAVYTQQLTATRRAYEALKGLLLSGDVPVGHRLREERIAERVGVSRTPVRDAMHQLSGEGFLERRRDGGIYVVTPSVVVMGELYDVRRALELCTLRLAVHRGLQYDRGALGKLRNEWMDLNADEDTRDAEFVLLDEDFHARLAFAGGNRTLVDELSKISQRIRPIRSHDFITPGRIAATIEEHLAIVEAALAGEYEHASDCLERHITESQAIVEAAVAKAVERMLTIAQNDLSW
jgi:DNA-binding GntR family transcriptional regulator